MGNSSYDLNARTIRSTSLGYHTKDVSEIFEQQKKKMVHESMSPQKALIREARDSETHPNTVPIVLTLDVTGSMGKIPHELVKDGLPTLMSNLIQRGVPDAAILFLAVGDHEFDRYPLQVGQFESGDEELDMWLTRTYLEGGGGGNAGESYLLSWLFASRRVKTDAWDKRKKKGYIITIGDEPCLKTVSSAAYGEIFDEPTQSSIKVEDILNEVREKFIVKHLHIMHSAGAEKSLPSWYDLIGRENCIPVSNYRDVPNVVSELIVELEKSNGSSSPNVVIGSTETNKPEQQIIL